MIGRRAFIRNSAIGAGAFLFTRATPFSAATSSGIDSRIEVLLDEPLGTISPNIYGHFAEHLGGVIYAGIWVGPNSKVPNVDGIRKDLIEQMRRIKAPVVRYPGGCFADSYDWRDGIGPADKRPWRSNFWGDIESASSPAFQPRVEARFLGSDPLFPRRGFRLVGHQACRLAKHEVCS